jgi:cysteinyl-tRNA synthetase
VQNITDVDDKIITAANKQNIEALEYSRRYTERCLKDLDILGIRRADSYPKASETIPDMLEMIQSIIERGYGYESEGDVYFSVNKFQGYGKLSGQNRKELKSGIRVEADEKKQDALDFALWKHAKPGEPSWDSPWGKGRPGWHIECSAMSSKYLGLPFDIHGGGVDLRFPHHENEIAQAEAASGKQFARYWMHIGLLTINREKMSKSLGNILNIHELLEKWDAETIRFFFAQAHYRSPPDFSITALQKAEKGLERIYRLKGKLEDIVKTEKGGSINDGTLSENELKYQQSISDFRITFERTMDDDFNTPGAVATIFEFVNKSNKYLEMQGCPNRELCASALDMLVNLGNVLTLFQSESPDEDFRLIEKLDTLLQKYAGYVDKKSIESLIQALLRIRQEARSQKNWTIADNIRDELNKIGFEIEDKPNSTTWRKKL